MNESSSDEPIIADWPGGWPGRQVVDLDNVGDPGYWIEEKLPDVEEVLFCEPDEDHGAAEMLADEYIDAAFELQFPLPSEFGASEEETREMVIEDFVGFIREWRKRTLAEQEHAREKRKGQQ